MKIVSVVLRVAPDQAEALARLVSTVPGAQVQASDAQQGKVLVTIEDWPAGGGLCGFRFFGGGAPVAPRAGTIAYEYSDDVQTEG